MNASEWLSRMLSPAAFILAAAAIAYSVYARLQSVAVEGSVPAASVLIVEILGGRWLSVVITPATVVGALLLAHVFNRNERHLRFRNIQTESRAVAASAIGWVSAIAVLPFLGTVICALGGTGRDQIELAVAGGGVAQPLRLDPGIALLGTLAQLMVAVSLIACAILLPSIWTKRIAISYLIATVILAWSVITSTSIAPVSEDLTMQSLLSFTAAYVSSGTPGVQLGVLAALLLLLLLLAWLPLDKVARKVRPARLVAWSVPIVGAAIVLLRSPGMAANKIEGLLWGGGAASAVDYLVAVFLFLALPAVVVLFNAAEVLSRRFELVPRVGSIGRLWSMALRSDLAASAAYSLTIVGAAAFISADVSPYVITVFLVLWAQTVLISLLIWGAVLLRGRPEDGLWVLLGLVVLLSPQLLGGWPAVQAAIPFMAGHLQFLPAFLTTIAGTALVAALCIRTLRATSNTWMGSRE